MPLRCCVPLMVAICVLAADCSCLTNVQETWEGSGGKLNWGMAAAQGRRPNMEDAHAGALLCTLGVHAGAKMRRDDGLDRSV